MKLKPSNVNPLLVPITYPLPQFPQTNQPKEEWWRVKGGRAVRRPPAVFGNAYFSFWLERVMRRIGYSVEYIWQNLSVPSRGSHPATAYSLHPYLRNSDDKTNLPDLALRIFAISLPHSALRIFNHIIISAGAKTPLFLCAWTSWPLAISSPDYVLSLHHMCLDFTTIG